MVRYTLLLSCCLTAGSSLKAENRILRNYVWTNMGAIYDPVTNTWTSVNPPSGWSSIGDALSVALFNGTFMLANCCTRQQALLNPSTMT